MVNKFKHHQLFLLTQFLVSYLFCQTMVGGDAILKFGESKNEYNYSEVLMNLNIDNGGFSSWLQFEFSEPPELGKNINGLRKFRADYVNGPFELSVGDIYKIWGRGLILNQFDDQGIDLDNGFRGLSFALADDSYTMNLIAGLSNISRQSQSFPGLNDRTSNYLSKHSLFGTDIEYFNGPFIFGLSTLQSRENHPIQNPSNIMQIDSLNVIHRSHGVRASYDGSSLSAYIEYAKKNTLLLKNTADIYHNIFNPYDGFALFGNINYYLNRAPFEGWSVSLEYKNYNHTKLNPDDRNDFVNNYDGSLIYTQPPTSIREHSSVLLARLIPQVDFNDEVGYQLQLMGPVMDLGNFTLNYQSASRTSLWEKLQVDTVQAYKWDWTGDSSVIFMPETDGVTLPYNELYIEMEGYIQKLRYQFGLAWTNYTSEYHAYYNSSQNNIWDDGEQWVDTNTNGIWEDGEEWTDKYSTLIERLEQKQLSAFTIPTILNYNVGNGWSVDIKYEFQRLNKGTRYYKELSGDEIFFDALNGLWDSGEDWTDLDGDGIWDDSEDWVDLDGDGIWDDGESTWYDLYIETGNDAYAFYDTNGNGQYDDDEWYQDTNGNGELDVSEEWTDLDGDGVWDSAEEFVDALNGVYDDGEDFTDISGDGEWTQAGVIADSTGSSFYRKGSNDDKIEVDNQNNHVITLGIARSPRWGLALTIESSSAYEYGPQVYSKTNPLEELLGNIIDLENKWIALELMININSSTRLDLMYGTQRGGIVCSNGVCRFIQPFEDGFKLNLTTIF